LQLDAKAFLHLRKRAYLRGLIDMDRALVHKVVAWQQAAATASAGCAARAPRVSAV
jgi:hypothetical protein